MDFENFTDRARGFIQSAQTLALRTNHQQLTPLHVLKVLLEDKEGLAANLIDAAGGDQGRAIEATNREFYKIPKVEGQGAGQLYLSPESARLFDQAEQLSEKAGDSVVTVERLLLAIALAKDSIGAKILSDSGVTPQSLNQAVNEFRKGASCAFVERRRKL